MNTITKEKEAELAEMIDREKARIIDEMEKNVRGESPVGSGP